MPQSADQYFDLTCNPMAVVAAHPVQVGNFVLVSRPPEWDEVLVGGYTDNGAALCRTTTDDGSNWMWTSVNLAAPHYRLPLVGGDGSRTAPAGTPAASVNWICTPPNGQALWKPTPQEVFNLATEASTLASHFGTHGHAWTVNQAGGGQPLVAIPQLPPGPVAPAGGAGAALAAPVPGAAGLGLGGGQPVAHGQADLQALQAAIQQLQAMSLDPRRASSSKRNKSKKKKKKSHHKKKDKRKRKKSNSTSSSKTSSRSRSRSSSSSSTSRSRKPLRWKDSGKDRSVSLAHLTHVDGLKLKKKGDLVVFAAKNPGALTAHFLAGVYARLSKGTITRSSQLREVSVAQWAHQFAGLTEVRDIKEVLTLAEILDAVNRRELATALDVLCQRILAIQAAKCKGGSWEKAEQIELTDSRKTLASSSMLALTNA